MPLSKFEDRTAGVAARQSGSIPTLEKRSFSHVRSDGKAQWTRLTKLVFMGVSRQKTSSSGSSDESGLRIDARLIAVYKYSYWILFESITIRVGGRMQISIPGTGGDDGIGQTVVPRKNRLFYAIRPDERAAESSIATALSLRERHGLRGRVYRTDRLHLTLCTFYEGKTLPAGLIELAKRAGDAIQARPFVISLDTALSFASKPVDRPLVLSGVRGTVELIGFRQTILRDAIREHFLGALLQDQFVPHMTVLYDDRLVRPESVEPISWTATELLLIHSHVGLTRHDVLARWQFGM